MRRIIPLLFAIPLLVVIAPSVAKAQERVGKETLRGLKGVYVLANMTKADDEQQGLRQNQLQTDVELRLRKAGIYVATETERSNSNFGTLYIGVAIKQIRGFPMYSYLITVELNQPVSLVRNPSMKILAATYAVGDILGTVGADHLVDVRHSVSDAVDTFINDYLAMNQK